MNALLCSYFNLTETIAHLTLLPSSVILYYNYYSCLHETLQLKNMINALFSSRDGGTKQFQYEGVAFGWKAIEEMFAQGEQQGMHAWYPS